MNPTSSINFLDMGDPYAFEFEDNTINENEFLQQQGPREVFNIEDNTGFDIDGELNDSDNEIDDDNFEPDNSVPKCVSIGYNHVLGEEDQCNLELEELYYPSSEELDYGSSEECNFRSPEFCPEKELMDPTLEVGKKFADIKEFKKAVRDYGVMSRTNIRFKVNDAKRLEAVCKSRCKWRVWASWTKKERCVQIKSITPTHTCSRDGTNRHWTYKYLAKKYLERFKVDPNWKTSNFIKTVKDDLKLKINWMTVCRTRKYARLLIEGSDEHQFGLLRSYAAEVTRKNLESTVIIAVKDSKFQGIYVCLEACKNGFLRGCRPLIGLDGCFLKGNFGGQMLSAVGLDANDCIYPIAYAIVERENMATWGWFLRHLEEDLQIDNNNEWTFMIDRQKGLQNVIGASYPLAEHRYCLRHMYTNFFTKGFKDKTLRDYLWRAAKSTTVTDYKFWMEEIKKFSERAYYWLMKKDPTEWSKSHFSTKCKSDILVNNLCECFNKILLEDREKSILTMLIDIQISFMRRIRMRRDKMRKIEGQLCLKIQKKFNKIIDMANECEVEWSGGPQSYVVCSSGEYVVDLPNQTCACRRWQLSGIPCAHALAAIKDRYNNPQMDVYVHDCYKVRIYLNCYKSIINPINGKNLWPEVNALSVKPPGWYIPKRGRKQTKRKRQVEEGVISHTGGTSKMKRKDGVEMTCSVCGLTGHNKRYHARDDAPVEDWYENDMISPITDKGERLNKLVRQRMSNTMPANQEQPSISEFMFMPTPEIVSSQSAVFTTAGPTSDAPGISRDNEKGVASPKISHGQVESIFVDELVKDLQEFDAEENLKRREVTARNQRVMRGSMPFAEPRTISK